MTQALIALALSMGLAASPPSNTQMAANNAVDSAASRASAPGPMSQAKPAAPERTYCTSGTITGSRVTKQECKTKAQWAKEGVDIEDLLNSKE